MKKNEFQTDHTENRYGQCNSCEHCSQELRFGDPMWVCQSTWEELDALPGWVKKFVEAWQCPFHVNGFVGRGTLLGRLRENGVGGNPDPQISGCNYCTHLKKGNEGEIPRCQKIEVPLLTKKGNFNWEKGKTCPYFQLRAKSPK